MLKCSGCQYVYYCNRECQKQAWPIHKAECVCLRRANGKIIPDAARTMARIILKLNDGGDTEKGYYTEKFYRKFKDLMSRKAEMVVEQRAMTMRSKPFELFIDFPDIKMDQRRIEHIEALTGVLRDILGEELLPKPEEFIAIYGRVRN